MQRGVQALIVAGEVAALYPHNPIRVFEREPLEERSIHDAEDRGRQPNAQSKRHDRSQGKARVFVEHADAETQVLKDGVESPHLCLRMLFHLPPLPLETR